MALQEHGRFETENASRYLQQLCKHFAHKITVEYDANKGHAALPPGPADLVASDDALSITISAEDDMGLQRARFIIDDHLKRFAFREGYEAMDWQRV